MVNGARQKAGSLVKPRVGIAILNFNGADLTIRCLDHLRKIEWPENRLELVVVDNGSTDDSRSRIREAHPGAKLVTSQVNLGFAGGCNLAIRSMEAADYVALLNNDAYVEPGWLEPLVQALESQPDVGAACSKILFDTSFMEVRLFSPIFRLIGPKSRDLGVRISGLRVAGECRLSKCRFPEGFWERQPGSSNQPDARWTNGKAVMHVPLDRREVGAICEFRVSAETSKRLTLRVGDVEEEFEVNSEPTWISIDALAEPFDLINNAGSDLAGFKDSADRGILQPDRGQFDRQERVFAWCGCSALLSRAYLEDVGLFDERLFLYYEDFDLSWRGHHRGWSYVYVPESVVRHSHAATSGEDSDLFKFYVRRNRLLVLLKNAPLAVAAREAVGSGSEVLRQLRSDYQLRTLNHETRERARAFCSFLAQAPAALRERARIKARRQERAERSRVLQS
jgi:O-antigen biosynthesis protein